MCDGRAPPARLCSCTARHRRPRPSVNGTLEPVVDPLDARRSGRRRSRRSGRRGSARRRAAHALRCTAAPLGPQVQLVAADHRAEEDLGLIPRRVRAQAELDATIVRGSRWHCTTSASGIHREQRVDREQVARVLQHPPLGRLVQPDQLQVAPMPRVGARSSPARPATPSRSAGARGSRRRPTASTGAATASTPPPCRRRCSARP